MFKKLLAITIITIIGLQYINSQDIDFYSDLPDEELAEDLIGQMSNEELLGQVLMFSYEGDRVSAENLYWIREKNLGSIKMFGWNAERLGNMVSTISRLQEEADKKRFRIPLFVATDQEGGWVQHIKGNTSTTAGNLSLGATGNLIDSYNTGILIGNELKTLGINMNFAPTVDIYQNKNADVIGPKSIFK